MPESENIKTDWLILVPTKFELDILKPKLPPGLPDIEICGFGPIVPAARSIQMIQRHQPRRILLMGIAGSYSINKLPIGSAVCFANVASYGVGVGNGSNFQTAGQMGWKHWLDDCPEFSIGDKIQLAVPNFSTAGNVEELLVTTTTVSQSDADVADRLNTFERASAEDMEGFAVAAACRLSEIPLFIVRGISNQAGDREKANWKIADAIEAAAILAAELIDGSN